MSRVIRFEKTPEGGYLQIVNKATIFDGKDLVVIKSESPLFFSKDGEMLALTKIGDYSYIPCEVLHNRDKSFAFYMNGMCYSAILNESDWIDDETYNRFKEMDRFSKASDVMIDALSNGGTVDIIVPVVLEEELSIKRPTTINLKSDITFNKSGLVVESDVVIEGNGKLTAGSGGDYCAIRANKGNVVIKSGDFFVGGDASDGGNSCIYATGDASVVIEGGRFETARSYNKNGKDIYYVLNIRNNSNASIQCKGGTFVNYNPADGDDEMDGTFVAPGYKSVQTGDNEWTVMPE